MAAVSVLPELDQPAEHLIQPADDGDLVDAFGHALQRFQLFHAQGDGVAFHDLGGVEQRAGGGGFLAAADDVGAVAFAVSVPELTQFAMQAGEETARPVEVYLAVTALYVISVLAVNVVMVFIEKKTRVPGLIAAGAGR